jgi:hypothetical protein
VTGSTPSRSHISKYSASPRAYASIVLGARARSVQLYSHVAVCSCRPSTGHFSLSTTVPLKPSPKSVVAPRDHDHLGRFHVTLNIQTANVRKGRLRTPPPHPARLTELHHRKCDRAVRETDPQRISWARDALLGVIECKVILTHTTEYRSLRCGPVSSAATQHDGIKQMMPYPPTLSYLCSGA